ncbi:unnamed protein product [Ectocarpus sp. 12 AP-2014]
MEAMQRIRSLTSSSRPTRSVLSSNTAVKSFRAWRSALNNLKATRTTGRKSWDAIFMGIPKATPPIPPIVAGMARGTSRRWITQLNAVDTRHDKSCCTEDKTLADCLVRHPI